MPGLVDPMKSAKVERVSNADRAGYALRAFPNARRRKDQTKTISLQQGCPINNFPRSVKGAVPPFLRRRTHHRGGGPIQSIAATALDVIGRNGPFNLATTDKNDCREQKEMIDAAHTTNVIESVFATVRLRERATRGAGSRTKGLLMAFKLLDMAQQRWRHLDGAHLLPLVRAGVKFVDGVQKSKDQTNQSKDNSRREAA